jgi:sigma-E factor negative regulatory protein RseC
VETQRRSSCSACAAEKACGTATLAKVLGNRRSVVRVLSQIPLDIGDRVVIGIQEQALVRGSLAVYAVPILLLLAGALLGELGAQQYLWENAEIASVILGLAGLMGGLFWLGGFTRRIRQDRSYQPVVLRRLEVKAVESITMK